MKISKYLFIYLFVICSLFFGGCKDDFTLELKPVSSLSDASFWQTSEHWESHMNGIHSRLRTHQIQFLRLGEFRADIWGEQPFTGNTVVELIVHMNTINEDAPGVTGFAGFYTNINQLNLIIDKTLKKDILSESEKNLYLGQAYGLRAFYYFHLLRSWGGVVLNDEPSYGFQIDELEKAASAEAEIMNFIKGDIDKSLTHFGNDYSFKSKVLWSKAATLMLKSEVYLWSGRQMNGGAADANIAKNALQEIQTNIPSLKLMENFRDAFRYDNKENDEIIFAIHNQQDEAMLNWSSFVPRDSHFGSNFQDPLTGLPYSPQIHNVLTTGGGIMYAIYNNIYNNYIEGDTRKYESLQAAFIYSDGEYEIQPGVWQNKFQGSFELGLRTWTDDYPIYRYSDLLLLLAEAKSLLNEDPTNEINLVRQRAFGSNYQPGIHAYPNQTIDSNINEALLQERLYEFIAEGKRWYDLRRFGTEYVVKYTLASPERLLWPIDLNTLTDNPALKQTPGY